jgi:beta-glucanase (GH16 family)
MKRLFAAMLSMLAIVSCSRSNDGWELVWTEDFNGPEIDGSVWSRVNKGGSDWNDMMSLRPDLAYIEDGQLVLLGKNNDGSSSDTTLFVTGGVNSKGKKSFALARFEVKAKFNCVNGFWPALWLMPDSGQGWPFGGEIDIMEHLNADSLVYQTVHSDYTLNVDKESPHSSTARVDPGEWNIYAAEIYRDSLCMYTNGAKTMTYKRMEGVENQFPWSDHPFYFILSNQLGGAWVGPVSPEQLPSELRIDWIKVYQRKED